MNAKFLSILIFSFAICFADSTFAQSQHEMNQEAAEDFEKADTALNAVYKKFIKTLDEEGEKKLIAAQRAWIAFRDAQATFEADEARGGSMAPLLLHSTKRELTEERTKVLQKLLTDSGVSESEDE